MITGPSPVDYLKINEALVSMPEFNIKRDKEFVNERSKIFKDHFDEIDVNKLGDDTLHDVLFTSIKFRN